jgi:hypothetical protein
MNALTTILNKLGAAGSPQKIYFNLHLQKTQLQILSENKHKSGIYMIFNLVNTKTYIGSAISNRINTRFRNHCIHHTGSKLVHQAIQKYGLENFAFIILEYYPGFVKKENLTKRHLELLARETVWIQNIQPEYNILSSEVGSRCQNLNLNKTFKALSEENLKVQKLLSKIASLRNQNKELREHLAKMASKPVTLYNKDGTVHSNFSGIRAMARHFKCCHKTINLAIKKQSCFKNIGIIRYNHEKDR